MQIGLGAVTIALLAGVGAIAYFAVDPKGSASSSSNDIAKYCRSNATEVSNGLTVWSQNGTIVRYSKERMEVEDKNWAEISHDSKVSIAVFGYCNAIAGADSDKATVLIRGYRDGAVKASIVDGNYFDS